MINWIHKPKAAAWIIAVLLLAGLLAACGSEALPTDGPSGDTSSYTDLTSEELHTKLEASDIFLVNVHIPHEGDIPGTDARIPFDQVRQQLSAFPQDVSEPIFVYCRSGNMSEIAAETLTSAGYQQVFNLSGGYREWIAQGYEFLE
ncbi:MAG: rhodanese-like domain-containing protein [Anaerolineales bacterium]